MADRKRKHCDSGKSEVPAKGEKVETRANTDIWLLGQPIQNLDKEHFNQLPTIGQVLRRLFFDLKKKKLSLTEGCLNAVGEVLQLWFLANLPTTQKRNAVAKLKKNYEMYDTVRKNRIRRGAKQLQLETRFCSKIKQLFDVSHAESITIIRIPEDLKFLEDQKGERKMVMASEDKDFRMREERKQKRTLAELARKEKGKSSVSASSELATPNIDEIEMLSTSTDFDTDDSVDTGISNYYRQRLATVDTPSAAGSATANETPDGPESTKTDKRRRIIDDPMFIASLDRTKTTPREAMHIVAPALKAAGVDVNQLTLSSASLYRSRKQGRQTLGTSIQEQFSPNTPLVVHFDGKVLPDSEGGNSDRLAVIVSGKNVEKLLGIPKLPSGKGIVMGNAIVELLKNWNKVTEFLAALCFDTTSANTGVHTGAITFVQNAFNKRLLFLGCRHHIYELIATAIFDLFFVSSGPQIALFKRFKEKWPLIDVTNYVSIDKETAGCVLSVEEREWLEQTRTEVVAFLLGQLSKKNQPRDDYLEFIKLSLITLGEGEQVFGRGNVVFNRPGAMHQARWMAKGIYCLKIFCFREQFQLSNHELQALRRICLFTTTIYVKAWITTPDSINAPFYDLSMLQTMESFSTVDKEVSEAGLRKLRGQLWYLSEDLIGLSLFSNEVYNEEKQAMVEAFTRPEMKRDLRRFDSIKVKNFQSKTLSDFVTKRSMNLFTALKLNNSFLGSDPATWNNNEGYIEAKNLVSALRVVNDCAERGVKLAADFNMALTHDEEQRQLIFQVVEQHRKTIRQPRKSDITKKQ